MEAADDGRRQLAADRLFLVEGRDEVGLFTKLIESCFEDKPNIQVIDVGGKTQFARNMATIRAAAQTRPILRCIGVVRDADDNARGAFDSVCHGILRAGYGPPRYHGGFSTADPSVGVFIVPDGTGNGAIENLCRQSVQGEAAAKCADEYLDCLVTSKAMRSTNADKNFAHAYFASIKHPVANVGIGALQGAWNFRSPAFAALVRFVRQPAGPRPP